MAASDASGPVWTTACPDWKERIVAGKSLIPFAPLFPEEAEAALEAFNSLTMVDAAGSPTLGEVSRQWVLDLVASIFGAYDPESGRRLIKEWLLLIAKKNGKSTNAAGIMMVALLLNWRISAEMGILAPTKEVADNAYKPAADMIKADPDLSALLQVQDHIRKITHRETGATLQVVAADSETVAGKKWAVTLIDELWLFGKKANADKMLLEATGGMASRPEGFVIYLSTQSDEPPAGVFKTKLDYARGVRDGEIIDPEFCPVLYEFPPEMIEAEEHLKPENFYIPNPNMGASVDPSFISRKLREAGEEGKEGLQIVLSKYLNVQIGTALRKDRWAGTDFWQKAGRPGLTLDTIIDKSDVLIMGVDGGGLDDMLGVAVLGRDEDTGSWMCWARAWVHPVAFERRKENAARWHDFEKAGDLVVVKQVGDDIRDVVELANRLEATGKLLQVGVDPIGIGDIPNALRDEVGIDVDSEGHDRIIGIPQGYKLSGAIKTAERRLAEGTLIHSGSPLMAWCVGNAKAEQRGNATLVTKQASGPAKIDPLCALFDAVALMVLAPESDVITDTEVMAV